MSNRFDISTALDVIQDIGEAFSDFMRGRANSGASEQLGLSRSEYLKAVEENAPSYDAKSLPEYSGHPFDVVNNNEPAFAEGELSAELGCERYSDLDALGRCGIAFAMVSRETMPKQDEARKTIKHVVPSGWSDAGYDFVEGGKLYNRCHLIGYGLTAEQDNPKNIITGTHYLNHAMRVFENMVADHCKAHEDARVLFRVTPRFVGDELVARGVQLEALSICEDDAPLRFNVYLHNVQPGVRIDYATGNSRKDDSVRDSMLRDCLVNDATKVLHRASCPSARSGGLRSYSGVRDGLIGEGYRPCGRCKP